MEGKAAKKKGIIGTLVSVSGIVILAKVLGFVKQMATASAFGATIDTDIISMSESLIGNVDYLLVQALATAFIPTYIYAQKESKERSKRFVSNTITVFLIVSLLISLVFSLGSPIVARILAPTYSDELSAQLSAYIRYFAPVLAVIVELSIFNSLLKANEHFIAGELINVNQSVILIVLIILIGGTVGPDTLVIGFYAYAVFNLIFLMICARKYWGYVSGNPFRDENVKKLLKMMGPLLAGYSMVFVNQQVDKIIVSGLGEGTVTAMNYASVLSNFVATFIGSICGVLFTYITQNIADKKDKDAADLTMNSTIQMVTLLLPISVLTVLNAEDIVTIVFARGEFGPDAVHKCALSLAGYGFMFVPYIIRELFSRFQYAYGDSKTPMVNSIISIVFNIIFSIVLSRFMGVLGVALATSISVLVCAVLNIVTSVKKNNHFNLGFLRSLPLWLIGSAICVGVSLLGIYFLSAMNPLIRFVIVTAVSMILYCLINIKALKPLIMRFLKRG